MKTLTAGALIFLLVAPPAEPIAVWCSNCSTEVTHWVLKGEAVAQTLKQAQLLEDAMKNSKRFEKLPWAKIDKHLKTFETNLKKGLSIAIAMRDADRQYRRRFPGYKPSKNFGKDYAEWVEVATDTIEGVIKATSNQRRDSDEDAANLEELREMANDSEGRLEAAQVGAMIGAETAAQLHKLQDLLAADISAKTAYYGYEIQRRAAIEASAEQFFAYQEQPDRGNKAVRLR